MKKRFSVHYLLPGLSLVFTVFVFAPVDLYVFTKDELWFPLTYLLRWLGIFSAASFTAVTLLAWLFPKKASMVFCSIIYAISMLTHLQGSILLLDYGELDGHTINWSSYTIPYLLDALLWIIIIALFVFLTIRFSHKFRHILEIAACVLLGIQILSLSFQLFNVYTRKETREVSFLSAQGLYTVSPENNTVVFVLDEFDSHLFESLRQKYPDFISQSFQDFTFYPDTVGGAIRTKYALPYMLTGTVNREEQSYLQYLTHSFESSPLIQELSSGQYDSGLYTSSHYVDMSRSDAFSNITRGIPTPTSRFQLTKQYMKLVAFRCLPSILSKYFWMYTGDFEYYMNSAGLGVSYATNDLKFYKDLITQKLRASSNKPCFRFYHLLGAHTPYTLNENIQRVPSEETSEEQQAIGVLKIVSEYLSQLKALGIYDRTTLIITADHGAREHSKLGQSPVFMVKEAGSSHPFDVSSLPLSFASLPDILTSALRNTLSSMETWKASSPRYFYVKGEDKFVVNITEYAINGPVWDTPAKKTGVVYHEDTLRTSRNYTLGTALYFDERDTARPYFVSGFSVNEATLTWTEGNDAEMLFELNEVPGRLLLRTDYSTYNESQTVEVWVNDQLIETYVASGEMHHITDISAGTVPDKELRLRLHLPDACSPASRGIGVDNRLLSLAMNSLTISAYTH